MGGAMVPEHLGRRELLALGARSALIALAASLALARGDVRHVRPPGFDEGRSQALCNGCLRCVQVCPTEGLRPGDLADGLDTLRRPILDGECIVWTGECFRCIKACPTGALREVAVDEVKLGTARIDASSCLPFSSGKRCYVCYEHCPVKGVITLSEEAVPKPVVASGRCIGCGMCQEACPVQPTAIRVFP